MAKQDELCEDVTSLSMSFPESCLADFAQSATHRVMQLELLTLPQFNITLICRCLSVSERLCVLSCVHKRFNRFVLQPQCFQDLSFFPKDEDGMYYPKIISSNGNCGITYVEINIFSTHSFVEKVAMFAGMWNFKADLWNEIDWPKKINIESLQLTLDHTSNVESVHLDYAPSVQQTRDSDTVFISPTTKLPMAFPCNLRNLFFIRFDSNGQQPIIYFPYTLWGLGLQSFTSTVFSSQWWMKQIERQQRFEGLRFLVLSCCDFQEKELQILLDSCTNLEHLSLRYVRWQNTIALPTSLLSFGYFPDSSAGESYGVDSHRSVCDCHYSVSKCTKLWQISTRLNENVTESISFLNACSTIPDQHIKRIKFEYIRQENAWQENVDLRNLVKWEKREFDDISVAIPMCLQELKSASYWHQLCDKLGVDQNNFVSIEDTRFHDCPYWSEQSKDFIHMTKKRKLLLR